MTPSEICRSKLKYWERIDSKRAGQRAHYRTKQLFYYYLCPVCAAYNLTKKATLEGRQHRAYV